MEQVPELYDRSEAGHRMREESPSMEYPPDDGLASDRLAMDLLGYMAKRSPDGKFIKWEPKVNNPLDAKGEGSIDKAA